MKEPLKLDDDFFDDRIRSMTEEVTKAAAENAVRNRDLIVACMYIDYCKENDIGLFQHLDQLKIKIDENDHRHVFFRQEKIGQIWPPDFKEKKDGPQRLFVCEIKYEPFKYYFDNHKMLKKAEQFLAEFRHLINNNY